MLLLYYFILLLLYYILLLFSNTYISFLNKKTLTLTLSPAI